MASALRHLLSRVFSLLAAAMSLEAGATDASSSLFEGKTNLAITLDQCIELALRQNRDLQIERLNPLIARAQLVGALGYYDPVLLTDFRHEDASDSGGFDPADFSRDAIYSAESDAARVSLTGFLPTGLSYSLNATYANSSGERNGLNFASYNLQAGITVRQPLLKNFWIDQGRLVIRANRSIVRLTELGVAFVALDLVNQVQQAYYEFLYAFEHQQVQSDLRATRQKTLAGLELQIQHGTLTPADALSTRAQLAALNASLIAAENAVLLAENALRTLLGDPFLHSPNTPLQPAERLWVLPLDIDLDISRSRALTDRPDLAQLRTEVERTHHELRFRRNQLFPSIDLIAGYGRRGASTGQLPPPLTPSASAGDAFDQLTDGVAPTAMIGVIFSVPLTRTAERSNYRASRHLKSQAELRVRQKEELVLREVTDAFLSAQLSLKRARAAEMASGFAAQALATEERRLAGGTTSIYTVLQLQNDLLSARAAALRATADHLKAASQLHFAEGSLLDRRGIQLSNE